MIHPDFEARAELYLGSDRQTASAQCPKAFRTAGQAIRFALEQAAPSVFGEQDSTSARVFFPALT